MRTVIGALTGLGLTISGLVIGYFYLIRLNNGGDTQLIILSIFFVAAGIIILFWASREKPYKLEADEIADSYEEVQSVNIVDRNNKLVADFGKTLDQENKLKILKYSANSVDESKSKMS